MSIRSWLRLVEISEWGVMGDSIQKLVILGKTERLRRRVETDKGEA
jgi:hypothetical protein